MHEGTTARVVVVSGTTVFFIVEWLFVELARLPYRPPHDMNTFLGTEIYAIPYLMSFIAFGWLALVAYWSKQISVNQNDYLAFAALLLLLATVSGYLIAFPWWPVTPFELLQTYWR